MLGHLSSVEVKKDKIEMICIVRNNNMSPLEIIKVCTSFGELVCLMLWLNLRSALVDLVKMNNANEQLPIGKAGCFFCFTGTIDIDGRKHCGRLAPGWYLAGSWRVGLSAD